MDKYQELLYKLSDMRRQIEELARLETAPLPSSIVTYSGTPTAGAIPYWTGAGTIAHSTVLGTATVATLAGTQTLTNKSMSGAANTFTNISNAALTNSSVTIGATSVSLGGTAGTVSGLTLTSPTIGTAGFGNANHAHIGASSGGQLDHNTALTGLTTGDPHTQYHNDTRGDVRYGQLGTANTWSQDNTFSTNVGVGGPSPIDSRLHVRGTNAQSGGITIESNTGTAADRLAVFATGNFGAIIKLLSASGGLQFQDSSGNSVLFVDGINDRVGVMTTTADSALHVLGTNAQTGGITIESSAGTDADRLAIFSSGNFSVALKVLSASGTIQIQDSAGNIVFLFDMSVNKAIMGGLTSAGAGGALATKAGTSTNDAAVGGVLYVSTSTTGNVGTGTDVIASYSVPADTLAVNGQSISFEASGTFTNNANSKTLSIQFGADTLGTAPSGFAGAAYRWIIRGVIIRTGATTQKGYAEVVLNATSVASDPIVLQNFSLGRTLSSANTLSISGAGTSNNDIVCEAFIVKWNDNNT